MSSNQVALDWAALEEAFGDPNEVNPDSSVAPAYLVSELESARRHNRFLVSFAFAPVAPPLTASRSLSSPRGMTLSQTIFRSDLANLQEIFVRPSKPLPILPAHSSASIPCHNMRE